MGRGTLVELLLLVLPLLLLVEVLPTLSRSAPDREEAARSRGGTPLVINTWPFTDATQSAWAVLEAGGSAVDAVVAGCTVCEDEQCDMSVGYGGSPDENGETTLDALVVDGDTLNVGAVGALRRVKGAIRAAQRVLEHTGHSLLVGTQATAFALATGLPGPENLTSPYSEQLISAWKGARCQPNFWVDVVPPSNASCGPYRLPKADQTAPRLDYGATSVRPKEQAGARVGRALRAGGRRAPIGRANHDTITMVAIHKDGSIAAGGSTNGLTYKVPGRVGDAAIAGAGAYADSDVGGCGATGDGDVMMRFVPCYQVVESMRQGLTPKAAAEDALSRIHRKYPLFQGAIFAVNRTGHHAGAVRNWNFQYSVRAAGFKAVRVYAVEPPSSLPS